MKSIVEILIDKAKKEGLKVLECFFTNDIKDGIFLENATLDDLIEYAKENGIKYLFYNAYFLESEKFIIDEEEARAKYRDIYDNLSEQIKEHNKEINKINFEIPTTLYVFCLHEGKSIIFQLSEDWADELKTSKQLLEELETQNREAINELETNVEQEKKVLKEELIGIILSDPDFELRTNQRLRQEYIMKFLFKKENSRFNAVFTYYKGSRSYEYNAVTFIDYVWGMKKNRKYSSAVDWSD